MNLKLLFFLSSILIFNLLTSCDSHIERPIAIIPEPNEIIKNEGVFRLTKETTLITESENVLPVALFFQSKVKASTGFNLNITNEKTAKQFIYFLIDEEGVGNEEGYDLVVKPNVIEIRGRTKNGLYYGLQTLLQLLPAEIESQDIVKNIDWTIPCVEIKDEPRFTWRGMHLDVCRHFVPVENIKKHLDMMAMYKMNKFHWHLTEDQGWRIEIKKYPLLTQIGSKRIEGEGNEYGGFYTQEEVKEIVAYASERMIEVIPEIELPGHALAALTAYPEFSCAGGPFKVRNIWGVEPDVYCAGKEETFEFLENIIAEVVALFPSQYFHIGGDECPKTKWETCKLCQHRMKKEGLKDEHELQSYFVQRIEKVLITHGKKMIGWDEILEGGLAKSAAVMSWRGEEGGIEAASDGHDVIMTPGEWCYLDHFQGDSRVEPVAIGGYLTLEKAYSYEPVPEQLTEEMSKHILGTQGNVWTEYMFTPELIEYFIYPRIIALAEVNWTRKGNKNFTSFLNRMENQMVRMDMHNINYHIPLPEGPCGKVVFIDTTKVEFTTTRPVKMHYTLDGSKPNLKSNVYKEPFVFTNDAVINIASALSNGKMSRAREVIVEKQSYLPAETIETTQKGLMEQYAEGTFIHVADLQKVKKWTSRVITGNVSGGIKTPSASVLRGFLDIPEDGVYEFSTNLDQFYLGKNLLIDNDGEVKRFSRNNTSIALGKGKHSVKLVYLNNIIGGWPQAWNGAKVRFRKQGAKKFTTLSTEMYTY